MKRLAYGGADGLYVVEAETGKEILQYKSEAGACDLHWSPNSQTLAFSLRWHQGCQLLDVATGAKPCRLEDFGESLLIWDPDGSRLARIRFDCGCLRLYDAATGKRARTLPEGMGMNDYRAALAPDGRSVAVNNGRCETSLASVDTGQIFATLKNTSKALVWSPDGKRLATGGPNQTVLIWEDGDKVRIPLNDHQQDVTCLAWSPDGKRLASSALGENRILLWTAKALRPGTVPEANGMRPTPRVVTPSFFRNLESP